MRKPAEWMYRSTDDPILEYIRKNHWGTPKTVAKGGLLDNPARGVFVINDAGIAYLEGELDANEL